MTFNLSKLYLFINFKIAKPFYNTKLKIVGKIIHQLLVLIFKVDIDVNAKISQNVNFPHFIGIVIGPASIGKNTIIRQNVTIGRKNTKTKKYPKIGNNVEIGAGAIILGDIKIGDNVIIGALSFVDKNIEKNSIVYNKKELIIKKNEI